MRDSSAHRGRPRRYAPALFAALLAACGGGSSTDDPAKPFAEGTHPLKQPPPYVVGSFAIDVPSFTLEPGDEKFPCTIFPLVIDGPSRVVGGAKLTVGRGMHHGNITTRKKTGEGVRACPDESGSDVIGGEALDIINGGAVLFGKGYDPDNGLMTQYSPAIDLSQHGTDGAGATFSCSWRNPLDKSLGWGVGDNEMCVMYGYAYPPSAAYSVVASAQGCLPALPP